MYVRTWPLTATLVQWKWRGSDEERRCLKKKEFQPDYKWNFLLRLKSLHIAATFTIPPPHTSFTARPTAPYQSTATPTKRVLEFCILEKKKNVGGVSKPPHVSPDTDPDVTRIFKVTRFSASSRGTAVLVLM